jgi:hypothetical protein
MVLTFTEFWAMLQFCQDFLHDLQAFIVGGEEAPEESHFAKSRLASP